MLSALAEAENESGLVARAQTEIEAFTPIYQFYFPRVYNYVRYRVRDPQLTDDLTAQIFERVLLKLPGYQPQKAPFGAWLFTIAHNIISDHFRTQKRWRWLSFDSLFNHATPDQPPEAAAASNDQKHKLLSAVSQLGERERDILALKFAAQMNNRQIAVVLDLSEQTSPLFCTVRSATYG